MLETVYRTEARFLQHLQTQKANITQYQTVVGATTDDVTEISNDADVFEFLVETCSLADEFKTTANGIKAQFFSIKVEPPAGDFMTAPRTAPPAPVIAGAVKRSRERDQRFLRSKGITEAARIALDLVGDKSNDISPDEVKPKITVSAAATGYEFAVVISNRQKADMYDVMIQRDGLNKWEVARSGTGKSCNVTVIPFAAGKPEQMLVRVQLKKNNANYGAPSDPTYVTVNP